MGIYGKRGVRDYYKVKYQYDEVKILHTNLKKEKETLENKLENFRKNTKTQERVIREILGYIKSNETIIEFDS
jgi:cell division protein FtsB